MSRERPLRPPSGMPPPARATLPDGLLLNLVELAEEISDEHLRRHPDELARYGETVRDWCRHDNQHLLNWAVLDVCGGLDFGGQVAWLAHVLGSRGYLLANLADDLRVAARVVRDRVNSEHADNLADVLVDGVDFIDCT